MSEKSEDDGVRSPLAPSETRIALEETRQLLRSVLDSTPNTIVSTDRQGHLVFASHPGGVAVPSGKLVWELTETPQDRDRAKAAFDAVMATGEQQTYEARGITPGVLWHVTAGPRYERGEIAGVTFVASDITEHRALETRLAIADRLASIGTLAAGVAHEVNNPLTYVLANVAWAAREADARGDAEMKERLDAALEGVARIRDVVSDLNTFAHVDSDKRQVLDVHGVIEAALRLAQAETRYRARVVRSFGNVAPVLASEGRLGQVFLNLIINAAQALPEGAAERNEIVIRTSSDDGGRTVIEVKDSGVGIAPALIRRIFEPFVTTKPRGEGTGLGLYICRNVVTSLGGELTVCSTLGVGTTMRVSLPPADVAAVTVPPVTVDRARIDRRLRVLVADDERPVTDLFRAALAVHHVDVAHSGREALERLGDSEYDVVFCDLMMPDVTGMDVYQSVRAEGRGIDGRFIFMTGGPFTPRAQLFLTALKNHVLHKPFTEDDIRASLAAVVTPLSDARVGRRA